jgi:hypothetical protein
MITAGIFLAEAIYGFWTSVRTRSAWLRFFTWLIIPTIVGVLVVGPANFVPSGESGVVIFEFMYLLGFGLVATGAGSLIGLWVQNRQRGG